MKAKREEKREKSKALFIRNASIIIKEMRSLRSKLNKPPPEHPSALVDEILHSIFFLGKISNPPCTAEDIVTDGNLLNELKGRYPRPFRLCSSQLPKRSPISCVLDMIVHLMGQKNEDKIIKKMQELILQLKKDEATDLVSSTICVSQKNKTPNSVRYYGVSMSTSGPVPGRIIVAASCLSAWESNVADAVMTYNENKKKKSYFDGTIKLPKQVRCQAFSLTNGQPMPPCRSCGNLFSLTTSKKEKNWPYGNCAEPESVSNLLKNEKEVREKIRRRSKNYTAGNRQKAKETVEKQLRQLLNMLKFKWDGFYTPQGV